MYKPKLPAIAIGLVNAWAAEPGAPRQHLHTSSMRRRAIATSKRASLQSPGSIGGGHVAALQSVPPRLNAIDITGSLHRRNGGIGRIKSLLPIEPWPGSLVVLYGAAPLALTAIEFAEHRLCASVHLCVARPGRLFQPAAGGLALRGLLQRCHARDIRSSVPCVPRGCLRN